MMLSSTELLFMILVCSLFNDTVDSSDDLVSSDMVVVDKEMEVKRLWTNYFFGKDWGEVRRSLVSVVFSVGSLLTMACPQ